jgi:peptidoglycan/LPS O-acetylase OafA/YrhL
MERDRIAELDLLRFTAAASVVLFHATDWPSHPTLLTSTFSYGFMGVPLFFMISGFVILMTAQNRGGIEFINSRIARLYPSYWICVLLTALALTFLAHRPPSFAVIAANLTMQPRMLFDEPYIDPVYWTLVVEMKFYVLVWALIVTRQMKRVELFLTLWLILGTIGAFVTLPHWVNSLLIPMWASLFSGGCYLYLLRSRGVTLRRLITFGACVALSIYYALQYQSVYTHTITLATQLTVGTIMVAMSAVFLLVALRKWSLPRSRLWMWLGCLTYPIYLTHAEAGHHLWDRLGGNEWARMWFVLALVVLVSLVLAIVVERRACRAFHRALDRGAQRLLERLGLREEEDRATAMR